MSLESGIRYSSSSTLITRLGRKKPLLVSLLAVHLLDHPHGCLPAACSLGNEGTEHAGWPWF
jgi:hypothetical protein